MLAKAVALSLLAGLLPAKPSGTWEFPNFSDRIQVIVENHQNASYDGVAVVKLADLTQLDPKFPGSLLLAEEDRTPARALATQMDRGSDVVAVEVHLAPHEKQTISFYYSTTLQDQIPLMPRVHASHNYGYNHSAAAIESELIGYRIYGGFFLDVQAHAKGARGLFNTMLGYSSITHPPSEGEDVVHIGDTLGLGGMFLRLGNAVYRPPVSTPDYAHRPAQLGEPTYEVLSAGPLRAIVEERLADWIIGEDHVSLRARYEMDADQEVVHCHWWLTPLQLTHDYEIGAGVRDLLGQPVAEDGHIVTTDGVQEQPVGRIALGLRFDQGVKRAGSLRTPDGGNEIVLFPARLTAGATVEGEYTVAAAWQGSGWTDPAAHVRDVLQSQSERVIGRVESHDSNPHPEALEREPK